MRRGEVWWVEHPEAGRRPCCILTRPEAIPLLRNLLVAPATTQIRGIESEVRLGREHGMPRDCVLSLDNVEPISKALFTECITTLGTIEMVAVCLGLRFATGC